MVERGRQDHPHPPGAGPGLRGPALVRAARVRPVLGAGRGGRHRRRHARLRQRLPALHQRVGGRPRRRDDAVQGRLRLRGHRRPRTAGRSSTPIASLIGHGLLHAGSRPADRPGGERQRLGAPAHRRTWSRPTRSQPARCSRRTRSRCSSATSTCTRSTRRTRWASSSSLGADHVLFGSDYPHPEGMADPISFVDELEGLPEEDIAKVMGGNLARLMNVGVPA